MKVAVIDLGTNTCNLLIAEWDKKSDFTILHRSKQLVQLGDDKIKSNQISPMAAGRVVKALGKQRKIIEQFGVTKVKVVATSAVRSAENRIVFLEKTSESTGWIVKVVQGEKEAELVFKGVLLAFGKLDKPTIILDIGGGSNELILAHNKEMLWKESKPAGMARVINQFKLSDPLKQNELKTLHNFFTTSHQEAFRQCKEQAASTLVGCSGSFDTIADIIDHVNPGEKQRRRKEIPLSEFHEVYEKIIGSTRKQRLEMTSIDRVRIDLIVPAVVLIGQLIKEAGITQIFQTDYALREGVLFEMME